MLSERDVAAAIGGTAYTSTGDKIGTVERFFADERTGAPSWVAVTTGLFGTRHSLAPATEASYADGGLRLPVTVDEVKSAPHLTGDRLGPDDEASLRRHYGLESPIADGAGWTPTVEGLQPPGAAADDDVVSGPPAPATMPPPPSAAPAPPPAAPPMPPPPMPPPAAYSAPSGTAATEHPPVPRVRLVRFVVTEEVQITVPIRREEVRLEEVPLEGADDGAGESLLPADESYGAHSIRRSAPGDAAEGQPDEIVLHTERPVVTVEVVPTERVRLLTETVQGQGTATQQVQREPIVVDETPSIGRISPR